MKKSIIAGLLVIALIVSNIPSACAEPITLTVMAIAGVTAVALSATTDMAVHNETAHPAVRENGGRKEFSNRPANEKIERTLSEISINNRPIQNGPLSSMP